MQSAIHEMSQPWLDHLTLCSVDQIRFVQIKNLKALKQQKHALNGKQRHDRYHQQVVGRCPGYCLLKSNIDGVGTDFCLCTCDVVKMWSRLRDRRWPPAKLLAPSLIRCPAPC